MAPTAALLNEDDDDDWRKRRAVVVRQQPDPKERKERVPRAAAITMETTGPTLSLFRSFRRSYCWVLRDPPLFHVLRWIIAGSTCLVKLAQCLSCARRAAPPCFLLTVHYS